MQDSVRWERMRGILEGALELEGEARARWIAQACAGDRELAEEVAELLEHDTASGGLEPLDHAQLQGALDDAQIGSRVGPYALERRIGVGGMGVVYLARRTEADFEQAVALKLIKRGMDSDDMLRRFRRERAVLARLQHPGIARLFDGGATQDGRPWLAMEYVEGLRIDDWCAQRRLSIRARIELVAEVCAAVQHAHQGLVVHRDIKPSNILVTADGAPKLLDFGIAKVLGSDGHDTSEHTLTELRRLTPAYASPQQLAGKPVTTACDVYSLGVVLYELLAGVRPFQTDTAAERNDPPRPSALALEGGADVHAATTARLRRQLRGDLDTILLTALAPEPERRYSSVESFAADLRRHLDGLPIQARPATAAYVVSKFVRRNALAVAAGAAVLAALVVGLLVARAGYREAVDQRSLAEQSEQIALQESARARAVLELTRSMLGGASPHDVKDADYTLRQLLDDFDAGLAHSSVGDPQVESSVHQILGRSYRELGLADKAEGHIARALELAPDRGGPLSTETLELLVDQLNLRHDRADFEGVVRESAALLERLGFPGRIDEWTVGLLTIRGDVYKHLGKFDEAESDLRRVLAAELAADPPDGQKVAVAKSSLAKLLSSRGEATEAELLAREVLASYADAGRESSSNAASAHHTLATLLRERGAYDESRLNFERALEIERGLHGPDHPSVGALLNGLAIVCSAQGDHDGAERMLREALAIERKALGESDPKIAAALSNLGATLSAGGRYAEAEVLLRESLEMRRSLFGEEHTDVARARNNLANVLLSQGKLDEAEPLLRQALDARIRLNGTGHVSTATLLSNLARLLLQRGELDSAEDLARQAVEIYRASPEPSPAAFASALAALAGVRIRQADFAEARLLLEQALAIQRTLHGQEHADVARVLALLGEADLGAGEAGAAEALLREAEALQRKLLGADHAELARTLHTLGRLEQGDGRMEEAETCFREALDIRRRALASGAAEIETSARSLATLLELRGRPEQSAALLAELGLGPAR